MAAEANLSLLRQHATVILARQADTQTRAREDVMFGCSDDYHWMRFGTYLQHGQSPPASTPRTGVLSCLRRKDRIVWVPAPGPGLPLRRLQFETPPCRALLIERAGRLGKRWDCFSKIP
jgi:hypothetical protein